MFYTGKDAAVFLNQQEFIDTAIIPLVPISFGMKEIPQAASQAEYLLTLVNTLENQFKGRVVAFPSFSYVGTQNKEELLTFWKNESVDSPFKHILFLTTDAEWLTVDKSVLWTASIPLDSMDSKMRSKVIDDQIRQLIPRIADRWNQ